MMADITASTKATQLAYIQSISTQVECYLYSMLHEVLLEQYKDLLLDEKCPDIETLRKLPDEELCGRIEIIVGNQGDLLLDIMMSSIIKGFEGDEASNDTYINLMVSPDSLPKTGKFLALANSCEDKLEGKPSVDLTADDKKNITAVGNAAIEEMNGLMTSRGIDISELKKPHLETVNELKVAGSSLASRGGKEIK